MTTTQLPTRTFPGSLFPSDLAALDGRTEVTVAGRVIATGQGHLIITDAFARCHVTLRRPCNVEVGMWAQVRGTLQPTGRSLADATLLAVHEGTWRARGQADRFATIGPLMRVREHAKAAVRRFFHSRSYTEVDTPVRVRAPGTDVYLEPQACGDGWLITSPEFQHKRLLAGGLPRIFEFARCTRRDEVGTWHQPEFTMLEWYCLLQDFEGLLVETEALVRQLAGDLARAPSIAVGGHTVNLDDTFERVTVSEAFRSFAGVGDVASLAAEDEDRYFQLMVDVIDPALSRIPRPVLLTHYPLTQAALAAPSSTAPGYAERFELFIGGVELCNGYGELTNAAVQRERFEADVRRRQQLGLLPIPIDEGLLSALVEGLPPCSGNAVGFDRLLAVLLEQPLTNVVSFPATRE